jgi:hypothetical protein
LGLEALLKRSVLAALAAFSLGLAACGDDDDNGGSGDSASEPSRAAFTLSGKKISGPKEIKGGLVEVTFKNNGDQGAGVQFVRGTDGHTGAEALKAAAAWGENGKALPTWVKIEGGTATAQKGSSTKATLVLPAGDYMAVDIDSNAATPVKVTGGESAELPTTDGRIEASEYKFTSSGINSGRAQIEFDNVGKEPHFFVAVQYKPGATLDDIKKFIRDEKGKPPFVEDEGSELASALFDGGRKAVMDVNFKPGKYALLCFIPDRAGGPPHVAKGMVSELEVQ